MFTNLLVDGRKLDLDCNAVVTVISGEVHGGYEMLAKRKECEEWYSGATKGAFFEACSPLVAAEGYAKEVEEWSNDGADVKKLGTGTMREELACPVEPAFNARSHDANGMKHAHWRREIALRGSERSVLSQSRDMVRQSKLGESASNPSAAQRALTTSPL